MIEPREHEPITTEPSDAQRALEEVVRPVLRAHGVDLFDLGLRRERSGWVLRVVIEHADSPEPGGGITVDVCADVSRDLSTALDVADVVDHAYSLEVSSPGLERPLRHADDYRRFAGKAAKLLLHRAHESGARTLRGTLTGMREQFVLLDVDGQPMEVELGNIRRGNLVFELPTQAPKKNKAKQKRRSGGAR